MLFNLTVSYVFAINITSQNPSSSKFIEHVNSKQNLWTAGHNFARDLPQEYFKRLTGSLRDNGLHHLPRKRYNWIKIRVPKYFDARRQWSNCPTLNEIKDQGNCGSCWAVASVSTMTDRLCINSKGKYNFYFSDDDILTCCKNCGGCSGGYVSRAWRYAQTFGVVSGGSYGSGQGCRPYEIPPCKHTDFVTASECGYTITPMCQQSCQSNYTKKYSEDKRRIGKVYILKTELDIQLDILRYGPVTVTFDVYSDFLDYKYGIYFHVSGYFVGGHAVKLLGWGEENKVKYWIAANSWNSTWGDRGFFKILRGVNHCKIEENAIAGDVIHPIE